jgi:hypothetical protein
MNLRTPLYFLASIAPSFHIVQGHLRGGELDSASASDAAPNRALQSYSPIADGTCNGDGGACGCGMGGDGTLMTMNQFYGDSNDQQVSGCGGAFQLTSVQWDAEWGGSLSKFPSILASIGFSQAPSFYGWEDCCYHCGYNLQLAGKLTSGWFCEKDFFSTGIWLKGKDTH